MNDLTYLWVNLAVISIPFVASFNERVAFFKEWKAFWPACLLTMAGFIAWDVVFTARGIWGFNPEHLAGIDVLGLPSKSGSFSSPCRTRVSSLTRASKSTFPNPRLGLRIVQSPPALLHSALASP